MDRFLTLLGVGAANMSTIFDVANPEGNGPNETGTVTADGGGGGGGGIDIGTGSRNRNNGTPNDGSAPLDISVKAAYRNDANLNAPLRRKRSKTPTRKKQQPQEQLPDPGPGPGTVFVATDLDINLSKKKGKTSGYRYYDSLLKHYQVAWMETLSMKIKDRKKQRNIIIGAVLEAFYYNPDDTKIEGYSLDEIESGMWTPKGERQRIRLRRFLKPFASQSGIFFHELSDEFATLKIVSTMQSNTKQHKATQFNVTSRNVT